MEANNRTQLAARFALIGAALLLVGSLVYASFRDRAAPVAAPTPGADVKPAVTLDTLEDAVKASPNDPKAWAALGDMHIAREEYPEAVATLEKAVALDPKASGYWASLGEARIYASEHDPMPPGAVDAFRKALALDAKDPRARYFLAVQRDLLGDHKGAIDDWFALLADAPPGAVWEANLRQTIAQVGKMHGIEVDSRFARLKPSSAVPGDGSLPGPSADQVQAAAALSPGQQEEMARGMVAKLEARLQTDPHYLDGWIMLMRSRMTLGEPAKAGAALKAAVAANPGSKASLEGQARGLGVP